MKSKFIRRFLGDSQARIIKRYRRRVKDIDRFGEIYKTLSDKELRAKTDEFKKRLAKESLDKLLPEAFAAVRSRHPDLKTKTL